MANATSLYSTVRNTSGRACSFSFLGAHGMRLAPNESVTVPGDILAQLTAKRASQRHFKAFRSAVADRGTLEIVKTPAVFLYDETLDETKVLGLNNGVLGAVDPSWAGSSEAD